MKKLIYFLFRIKKNEPHYETLVTPKQKSVIIRIMKISSFISLFLVANVCNAQISLDLGTGVDFKSESPLFGINVSAEKNNVVMSLKMNCAVSRKTSAPLYAGGSIGYDFKNIIPSIGYYNYYTSDGSKTTNKGFVGYSLRYNLILNERGGLFFEGNYFNKSVLLKTGFHVVF